MTGFFASMSWPLLLCLILGALLSFLGDRVLERRAPFADLALAQVAGLGAVWGVMLGWSVDADPWVVRAFAAAFTVVIAAGFTGLRGLDEQLPKEATAGAIYALAAAATMLIGASLHHGAEEVRDLLAGKILFVRPGNVAGAAVLYAAIGAFLFRFSGRMRARSIPTKKGTKATLVPPTALWEFAFYAAVGIAVSYAVPLVGVMLAFAYLLLPSATGALLGRDPQQRLRTGWIAALSGTLLGFVWAFTKDLPPEPAIAVCLGLQFVAAAVRRHLASGRDRIGGAISVLASVALIAMLLAWTFQLRAREEVIDLTDPSAPSGAQTALVDRLAEEPELWVSQREAVLGMLSGDDAQVRGRLLDGIAERGDHSYLDAAHGLLSDADDLVRDSAVTCVRTLASPESLPALLEACDNERDDYLKLDLGEALMELGSPRGLEAFLEVMASGGGGFARSDAFERLRLHRPKLPPGAYDANESAEARAAAVERLRADLGE